MRYSNEQLITYLLKLYKNLDKVPTQKDMDHSKRFPSASIYIRRFGSWRKALEISGIKHDIKHYSDEELINFILDFNQKYNRTPQMRDFDKLNNYPDSSTIKNRFGSWKNALNKAGLKPYRKPKKLRKDFLLKKLRKLINYLGRVPTNKDLKKIEGFPSSNAYYRVFGGLSNAIKILGYEPMSAFSGRLWKKWERFCKKCAEELYGRVIYQKKIGKCIPDIYIPKLNLVIEVMTRPYTTHHKPKQFGEYTKHGFKIEVWCIWSGEEFLDKKITYVNVDILKERLRHINSPLLKKCDKYKQYSDELKKELGYYTKEECIKYIKELANELRRTPTLTELNRNLKYPSSGTFLRLFGLYKNALKECGLREYKPDKSIAKEYLIKKLKEAISKDFKYANCKEFDKLKGFPSTRTYIDRFGSWREAIELTGIKLKAKVKSPKLSDNELLYRLEEFAKTLGHVPSYDELAKEPSMPVGATYCKRFGSYTKTLILAGLRNPQLKKGEKYTKEELVSSLTKFREKLGRNPKRTDFLKYHWKPSEIVFIRVFGNYTNALKEVGLKDKTLGVGKAYTKEYLIKKLKDFVREFNHIPTSREIGKKEGYPTERAYRNHFGSWKKGLIEAGLIDKK